LHRASWPVSACAEAKADDTFCVGSAAVLAGRYVWRAAFVSTREQIGALPDKHVATPRAGLAPTAARLP
jgi:hypothetical protein